MSKDKGQEKTKEQRIKAEKARLNRVYKKLSNAKKQLAMPLIERAAFMRVECEDLEEDLKENGWTELFKQGKDQAPYDRARPQGQTYQQLNANYQKIIKQLDAMLPPPPPVEPASDGFDNFISERDED